MTENAISRSGAVTLEALTSIAPDFCNKWNACSLSVFGSLSTGTFEDRSDVDIIVDFNPIAQPTLFSLMHMTAELEAHLQRPVDLLDRRAVEQMDNPYLRQSIISTERVIYAR